MTNNIIAACIGKKVFLKHGISILKKNKEVAYDVLALLDDIRFEMLQVTNLSLVELNLEENILNESPPVDVTLTENSPVPSLATVMLSVLLQSGYACMQKALMPIHTLPITTCLPKIVQI